MFFRATEVPPAAGEPGTAAAGAPGPSPGALPPAGAGGEQPVSRSLWLLLFLTVRARYRRIARGLATVKGALLMLFGAGFFALVVLGPLLASTSPRAPGGRRAGADLLQRFGPAGSSPSRSSRSSPAPGSAACTSPRRGGLPLLRTLLPPPAHRLPPATQAIHTLLSVLIMSLLLTSYLRGFWQSAVGLFLAFTFINLIQVAGSLLAGTLEERVVAMGRRFILGVLLALALAVFAASTAAIRGGAEFREALKEIAGSPALGWALLPLKTFSEVLAAPGWRSFLPWGAGAAAVDLVLLASSCGSTWTTPRRLWTPAGGSTSGSSR